MTTLRILFYFLLSTFFFLGQAVAADSFSSYPNRVTLRISNPTLAAMTGLASVRLNLGPLARPDGADLIVLDSKGREQPSLVRAISPDGEIELVFRCLADPAGPYQLLFGKPDASRPDYKLDWNLGRVVSDDDLPPQSRNHGLWEWAPQPRLSGSFSHTTPATGAMTYHGSTGFSSVVPRRTQLLNQYVYLDPDDPPSQVLIRLVFQDRNRDNPWDFNLIRIDCNWGSSELRPEPPSPNWNPLGPLPPPGKWTRLSIDLARLIARSDVRNLESRPPTLPPLYGIEFYTDKGRAFWDLTTLDDVPAETEIISFTPSSTFIVAQPPSAATFVYQSVFSLRLEGQSHSLSLVRFIPSTSPSLPLLWNFSDGSTSTEWSPSHLFTGTDSATVTLSLPESPASKPVSRTLTALDVPLRPTRFALDLVSCPKVVSASDSVLFNLRVEGAFDRALPATLIVSDLGGGDALLSTDSRPVSIPPGPDHPVNLTFARKLSQSDLRRLRLTLALEGRPLVSTLINIRDSASPLADLSLIGDSFLDAAKLPTVIRYTGGGPIPRTSAGDHHILLLGDLPSATFIVPQPPSAVTVDSSFSHRLERNLVARAGLADARVASSSVPSLPAWSLPWRQILSVGQIDHSEVDPDVIIIASADRLLLAGVSASDASAIIGVLIDQLHLRYPAARLVLTTPIPYTGFSRAALDYALALKSLALARDIPVADFYSRALLAMKTTPRLSDTTLTENGISSHRIPEELMPLLFDSIANNLVISR